MELWKMALYHWLILDIYNFELWIASIKDISVMYYKCYLICCNLEVTNTDKQNYKFVG